jgi:hypothetical protein
MDPGFCEAARAQNVADRAELSVARHRAIAAGLMLMLGRLLDASLCLEARRSELVQRLELHGTRSARLQLEETQSRESAALFLQAETLRRLQVAMSQLGEAEQLLAVAAARAARFRRSV